MNEPIANWTIRPVETNRAHRNCENCRRRRPDVKAGPGTGTLKLCNDCWFRYNPSWAR